MKTRTLVASLIVACAISGPIAVSALSVTDLQSQVKDLLSRVSALQASARMGAGSSSAGSSSSAATSAQFQRGCGGAPIMRTLSRGSIGEDVRNLQDFLTTEGYFTASSTGYYGALTAQAVAKWQSNQGLPSVGSVGPLTRNHLNGRCGVALLDVSPSQGTSPLTVTVTSSLGDSSSYQPSFADGQDTLIDFGDGSERQWVHCSVSSDSLNGARCVTPVSFTHVYSNDGTYTVKLVRAGGMCAGMCPETTLASKLVTVGAPISACTMEYAPVCGAKQVQCITAPCNPVEHTYGNRCMMNADGAKFLHEGECGVTSTDRAPVISSFSGPTSLAVNTSGTWTIAASDPENQTLSYSVTWGDENSWNTARASSAGIARETFTQTTTFTHAYADAGTYTVAIVVRDSAGNEARSSSTVQVGSNMGICTLQYDPVCGRPRGCANTCPSGMACPAICRLYEPQTYSNRCTLNNANADYLYSGACTN